MEAVRFAGGRSDSAGYMSSPWLAINSTARQLDRVALQSVECTLTHCCYVNRVFRLPRITADSLLVTQVIHNVKIIKIR